MPTLADDHHQFPLRPPVTFSFTRLIDPVNANVVGAKMIGPTSATIWNHCVLLKKHFDFYWTIFFKRELHRSQFLILVVNRNNEQGTIVSVDNRGHWPVHLGFPLNPWQIGPIGEKCRTQLLEFAGQLLDRCPRLRVFFGHHAVVIVGEPHDSGSTADHAQICHATQLGTIRHAVIPLRKKRLQHSNDRFTTHLTNRLSHGIANRSNTAPGKRRINVRSQDVRSIVISRKKMLGKNDRHGWVIGILLILLDLPL